MSFLMILKWIAAIGTIATGLLALVAPQQVQGFTGLRIEGGRGVTEVRSIFGGLFIALGAAVLINRTPATFWMLGIMYLGIAVVRGVSIFLDHSSVQSNWISLVVEIVLGLILIL
ncbi:MAG: DUF4345 family protein [Anaerolineales bacterium]|nr:DUF4345 family protein [Anaerolineales bacterium]